MKKIPEHKLRKEDEVLFERMKGNYISENERFFFEKMRYKEEYEDALMGDLILPYKNNEEKIVLYRTTYDEYVLEKDDMYFSGEEFESLSEVLAVDMSRFGLPSQTFFEWLRARDYEGVTYDRNNSLL